MKFMTKKWYSSKSYWNTFPMKLEIIEGNKKDSEQIFRIEYNNAFKKMKSRLPTDYEEEMFENIFNGYMKNVQKFFHREILDKIADIRLLALGKVFKDEYALVEKEIIKKDAMYAYDREFDKIKNKNPVNIKNNLDLHDCLITNIIKEDDKLVIELDSSGGFIDVKKIIFEDYTIIKEELNFVNRYCLYEELYIVDDQYELHLLIDVNKKRESGVGYFTIRAKNIFFDEMK